MLLESFSNSQVVSHNYYSFLFLCAKYSREFSLANLVRTKQTMAIDVDTPLLASLPPLHANYTSIIDTQHDR